MALTKLEIIEIDVAKLIRMKMLHVNFLLFDLRSKEIYDQGHIEGALHLAASEFLRQIVPMVPKKDTPVVIYDEDGVGAGQLALAAEELGYINVVNLSGGWAAYQKVTIKIP